MFRMGDLKLPGVKPKLASMTPSCPETIVALATAPGRSGVAIVRVSGALAFSLAERICKLKPKPRYNHFAKPMARMRY